MLKGEGEGAALRCRRRLFTDALTSPTPTDWGSKKHFPSALYSRQGPRTNSGAGQPCGPLPLAEASLALPSTRAASATPHGLPTPAGPPGGTRRPEA